MAVLYILAIVVLYGFKIYKSLRGILVQTLIQQRWYLNCPWTTYYNIGMAHVEPSFASANVLLSLNPK